MCSGFSRGARGEMVREPENKCQGSRLANTPFRCSRYLVVLCFSARRAIRSPSQGHRPWGKGASGDLRPNGPTVHHHIPQELLESNSTLPEEQENCRPVGPLVRETACFQGRWPWLGEWMALRAGRCDSEQFRDHRSGGQRGNGTTAVIEEVDVWIDAQHLEHRVMNVGRGDRPVLRDFSQAVG